jgi:hypothetical protein
MKSLTTDWRDFSFYPSTKPCVVCGSTEQTGTEPRFGYTVCEIHKDVRPVDIPECSSAR